MCVHVCGLVNKVQLTLSMITTMECNQTVPTMHNSFLCLERFLVRSFRLGFGLAASCCSEDDEDDEDEDESDDEEGGRPSSASKSTESAMAASSGRCVFTFHGCTGYQRAKQ
eukprot:m.103933 g.103933  ORF g.103933 m.103933 type:complete len:112 (-) comp13248_c0_seq5:125-460(-)